MQMGKAAERWGDKLVANDFILNVPCRFESYQICLTLYSNQYKYAKVLIDSIVKVNPMYTAVYFRSLAINVEIVV